MLWINYKTINQFQQYIHSFNEKSGLNCPLKSMQNSGGMNSDVLLKELKQDQTNRILWTCNKIYRQAPIAQECYSVNALQLQAASCENHPSN